ncbi:MAG: DUF1577 domain-containing protein [Spirochaetia bacterium]|nr:DUF1577 domain-containing protein [Spirochaetia bacterium]
MQVQVQATREWQLIREGAKVMYLVGDKLKTALFFVKDTDPPAQVYLEREGDDFKLSFSPTVSAESLLTLYTTVSRQVEVDFQLVKDVEPGTAIYHPVEARIGAAQRAYDRYLAGDSKVVAANFQVSKSDVPLDVTRPQITNSVIFREMEQELAQTYPGIRIYEYADKERPPETRLLNKRPLAILVEDINDQASYRSQGPDFADYFELLSEDESLAGTIRRYQEHHISSIMVVPLLMPMGPKLPFAFMYGEARETTRFTKADYEVWQEAAKKILQRVEDANTIRVKERQKVVNVSEAGVALEFTHPDLVKTIPHRSSVTFDLIFRMQAPLRFHGRVCYVKSLNDRVVAGIDLEGTGHFDTRLNPRERLKSYVKLLGA